MKKRSTLRKLVALSIVAVFLTALTIPALAAVDSAYSPGEPQTETLLLEDTEEKAEPEEAETESDETVAGTDNCAYDPQPAAMAEVQAAISSYNRAYQDALENGGFLAAINVAKPHWQSEVAPELMPSGWRCELVDWDTDFGAEYYTFFPAPARTSIVTLPAGSTDASLQTAINSASVGDVIVIQSDMICSAAVTVPATADITIRSDAGNRWTLTQSSSSDRHFIVEGKLTIENIVLDRAVAAAGGVQVESAGSLTMNNGAVIQNCYSNMSGGGVSNDGTFTMNSGAEISGNTATSGGGVYSSGTFLMNGGKISANEAGQGGGVSNDGTFTMNSGAEISGNTATYGGGVFSQGKSSFLLKDGEINGNTAVSGGGVFVYGGAAFVMEGGEITDNGHEMTVNGNTYGPAFTGGGVHVMRESSFTMVDGLIGGNTADHGGGVYISVELKVEGGILTSETRSSFTMGDPSNAAVNPVISGNSATTNGGGVYVTGLSFEGTDYNSTLAIIGANTVAEITDNTAGGAGGGIYTNNTTDYAHLTIPANTVFSGNTASCYYIDAVASDYPTIQSSSTSVSLASTPVNNYDINFENGIPYYPVTYAANGGSGTAPVESGKQTGDTFAAAINTFTAPAGMRFKEWNTQADGLGTSYAQGENITMPSGSLTLYAIWEPISAVYSLTVQAGTGGTIVTGTSGTYAAGAVISIAAAANAKYSFSGWTSDNGGMFANASSASTTFTMPADKVTITASFQYSGGSGGGSGSGTSITKTYTVTYAANGGAGSDHRATNLPSGDTHNVLDVNTVGFRYSGYAFTGWNTKPDGSGIAYVPGGSIIVTGNVTLYAQWEADDIHDVLEAEDHIRYLLGYPGGAVMPDNAITRAEAAAIFYRLLTNQSTAPGEPFRDVNSGEWYADAVNTLASIGVVNGYPDGTFRPNAPITRAEFAAIVSRVNDLASTSAAVFSDVSDGHWAISSISAAYAEGWVSGYPDGTFRPENSITRAEVVTIVNAMLDRKIDDDTLAQVANPYYDINSSHWAYADIIEASVLHEYERDGDGTELWKPV